MIDFEKIKILYQFGKNLNSNDLKVLINSAKKVSFSTNENLINEGETKKEIYFITKGLVRAYINTEKGDEITSEIYQENKVLASKDIILFNRPSRFNFEALEDTQAYFIDFSLMEQIISNNIKLQESRKQIYQNILKDSLFRLDSFILLTPEERYLEFVKENPNIINRVPNKYIANLLGITPVSLSRIRKRIVTKKK
ncbi:Crp/Fnr family transcriptional regulator [uncultured Polaribacter sp.]|uniref:Crp/Fnr family transcriptional regulator n=1 Tax=uncultured Polaribacter sp. TaxID=174711 RepID=UPI0026204C55|nr:Crp/Fnr family transcriptional regulator [uncultured Polaribacter sp.]